MIRRLLAVTLAAVVVLVGFAGAKRDALIGEIQAAAAQSETVSASVSTIGQREAELRGVLADARADNALRRDVLDEREPFLSALDGFSAQLERAEGRVDVSAQKRAVLAAQKTVLAERVDPDVVRKAAEKVDEQTESARTAVDDYEAELARAAAARASARASAPSSAVAPVRSGGGGSAVAAPVASAYDTVRAALNSVGGGWVPLVESDGSCAGGWAVACANSAGTIRFHPSLAQWSWGRIQFVMAHELAHIYQFRVWSALTSSGAYGALFGGNPEVLANCMATARGFGSTCGGEQYRFAAGVWSGAVG